MDRRDALRLTWGAALAGLLAGCGGGDDGNGDAQGVLKMLNFTSVTTADGVRLNVVETGNPQGPAIVFVHGISQSWLSWIAQLSDPALRAKYRLIAFDLRGHGASQGAQVALDGEGVPYAALSDYYKSLGDLKSAREWVDKGLAAAPGTRALQRRLTELDHPKSRRSAD